jgi:glutamine amidotransferase
VLIAHIRQKTVGPTSIDNTHPFTQDGWVFAHNGTIKDQAWMRDQISPERRSQVRGQTDSEQLFAFLLTRLDEADAATLTDAAKRETATTVLAAATAELRTRNVGSFNFLLSNGVSCFVHRFGRSLYLLERGLKNGTRASLPPRSATFGPPSAASWRERRRAVLIASERLTDESWDELPEGTFLRVDRDPLPEVYWTQPNERAAS